MDRTVCSSTLARGWPIINLLAPRANTVGLWPAEPEQNIKKKRKKNRTGHSRIQSNHIHAPFQYTYVFDSIARAHVYSPLDAAMAMVPTHSNKVVNAFAQ